MPKASEVRQGLVCYRSTIRVRTVVLRYNTESSVHEVKESLGKDMRLLLPATIVLSLSQVLLLAANEVNQSSCGGTCSLGQYRKAFFVRGDTPQCNVVTW